MNAHEGREFSRDAKTLAKQVPVPSGSLPTARGAALRRAAGLLGALIVVVVAAVVLAAVIMNLRSAREKPGSPMPAVAATATPLASPSASNSAQIAFPDATLLAGTYGGMLYRIEAGRVSGAPVEVCHSQPVLALRVSPSGRSVLVICAGQSDGQAVVLDAATLAQRAGPLPVVAHDDVAAWAPDERSIALLQTGSCDPRAPVCSVRLVLWDLGSGRTRVILPDEPLTFNLRWTVLGLSVSFPQGRQRGTVLWDGQAWHEYSARRLWLADASGRALLVEAGAGSIGGQVWERDGGQERALTASITDTEWPLALDGDRAIVWREQPPGGVRELVIYRGQQVERTISVTGICLSAQQIDRWLLCTTGGRSALAYSLDANQFAREPIAGLNAFYVIAAVPKK